MDELEEAQALLKKKQAQWSAPCYDFFSPDVELWQEQERQALCYLHLPAMRDSQKSHFNRQLDKQPDSPHECLQTGSDAWNPNETHGDYVQIYKKVTSLPTREDDELIEIFEYLN
ncbi:hypothetical protein BDZ89DRAFT_1140335 [Hymenopellis radicata]|nr:hypothetical protein BDZ89DRAFT_1140335 [Hymenopellis radicata]